MLRKKEQNLIRNILKNEVISLPKLMFAIVERTKHKILRILLFAISLFTVPISISNVIQNPSIIN